ncbi:MAG: hypothetical protein ACRDFC_01070 [Ignavibacteria bacterium]
MDTKQAETEIAVIRKIMEDTSRIIDSGKDFIVWGFVVFLGMLGTYYFIIAGMSKSIPWLWAVLIGVGWIYSIAFHWRASYKLRAKTLAGRILAGVWISSGIVMTVIGFLGSATGAVRGWAITPVISLVLGSAYLVSGIIYGRKWLRNLALGWWVGGIAMMLFPGLHIFLVFALMMVLFQIIPGFIFYSNWKKSLKSEPAAESV